MTILFGGYTRLARRWMVSPRRDTCGPAERACTRSLFWPRPRANAGCGHEDEDYWCSVYATAEEVGVSGKTLNVRALAP